eukprot:5226424-Amphidinium_carterae.1
MRWSLLVLSRQRTVGVSIPTVWRRGRMFGSALWCGLRCMGTASHSRQELCICSASRLAAFESQLSFRARLMC